MLQEHSSTGRWVWLGGLTTFGLLALAGGKVLVALGFFLLGPFAFFNNPLAPTATPLARPSTLVGLSWACGMLGVTAIVAAAARTWL